MPRKLSEQVVVVTGASSGAESARNGDRKSTRLNSSHSH